MALSELGRGLRGALGMGAEVEVDLDRVDASDALALRRPMEHTFVVRHDEPYVGASFLRAEGESIEKGRWGFLTHVKRHESKTGKAGDEPGGTES